MFMYVHVKSSNAPFTASLVELARREIQIEGERKRENVFERMRLRERMVTDEIAR